MQLNDPSPVLTRYAVRILQQRSHLAPYDLIELVTTHRWTTAFGGAVEPVRLTANAPVVVALFIWIISRQEPEPLGAVGVATGATNHQSLQQPARSLSLFAFALAILIELLPRGFEYGRIDQSRNCNLDTFLAPAADAPHRARCRTRVAPVRSQFWNSR